MEILKVRLQTAAEVISVERIPGVGNLPQKELLDVDDVASFLGVGQVMSWCLEGSLPCVKLGRTWRVRRDILEQFLRSAECSETLTGKLKAFLELPDNVLAIAQDRETMFRLDVAFFRVAEANGGVGVKYVNVEEEERYLDELRENPEEAGLEVSRLEGEGRIRLVAETEPPGERIGTLRESASEETWEGRSRWVNFNWEYLMDPDAVLERQEKITELIEELRLVVKTDVLEEELDDWPDSMQRQAQVRHAGTMWGWPSAGCRRRHSRTLLRTSGYD